MTTTKYLASVNRNTETTEKKSQAIVKFSIRNFNSAYYDLGNAYLVSSAFDRARTLSRIQSMLTIFAAELSLRSRVISSYKVEQECRNSLKHCQ